MGISRLFRLPRCLPWRLRLSALRNDPGVGRVRRGCWGAGLRAPSALSLAMRERGALWRLWVARAVGAANDRALAQSRSRAIPSGRDQRRPDEYNRVAVVDALRRNGEGPRENAGFLFWRYRLDWRPCLSRFFVKRDNRAHNPRGDLAPSYGRRLSVCSLSAFAGIMFVAAGRRAGDPFFGVDVLSSSGLAMRALSRASRKREHLV